MRWHRRRTWRAPAVPPTTASASSPTSGAASPPASTSGVRPPLHTWSSPLRAFFGLPSACTNGATAPARARVLADPVRAHRLASVLRLCWKTRRALCYVRELDVTRLPEALNVCESWRRRFVSRRRMGALAAVRVLGGVLLPEEEPLQGDTGHVWPVQPAGEAGWCEVGPQLGHQVPGRLPVCCSSPHHRWAPVALPGLGGMTPVLDRTCVCMDRLPCTSHADAML